MDNNFVRAFQFVAKWEWGDRKDGGYTNDPTDPGGETKWGISKRAHPNLDIKNLTLEQAAEIYLSEYWDATGCDLVASTDIGYAVAIFDTAVNCGVSRTKGWLKEAEDVKSFLELRRKYYYMLIDKNPKLVKFKQGWLNRLNDLHKYIDILSEQ